MMPTLFMMVGMPGAGKTTWARRYVRENGEVTHVDTNQIRRDITGRVGEQEKNAAVFAIFHRVIERALANGRDVIADSTALQPKVRARLYALASSRRVRVHIILFTNPKLAWYRNERRPAEEIVPEHAMRRMEKRLKQTLKEIKSESEQYDSITRIAV